MKYCTGKWKRLLNCITTNLLFFRDPKAKILLKDTKALTKFKMGWKVCFYEIYIGHINSSLLPYPNSFIWGTTDNPCIVKLYTRNSCKWFQSFYHTPNSFTFFIFFCIFFYFEVKTHISYKILILKNTRVNLCFSHKTIMKCYCLV